MRHLAVLTVSLLVVLAGCSGAPSGDTTTAEPTTDADVTTTSEAPATEGNPSETETSPGESELPPGLSEDGVTDAEALAAAHASALRNTSYAVVSTLTARDGDVVRARQNTTTKVVHDPIRTFQRTDTGGENPQSVGIYPSDVEVWTDGNGTWYAIDDENATTYRRASDGLEPASGGRTGSDQLYVLFGTTDTTLAGVTSENGTTLYRITATGGGDDLLAETLHAGAVENVSVSALVDEDGVVHRYRVAYDATFVNVTAGVNRTVRFTALGETTVERPAWYDEARNATDDG